MDKALRLQSIHTIPKYLLENQQEYLNLPKEQMKALKEENKKRDKLFHIKNKKRVPLEVLFIL
ncbi:hypothetical protein C1634_007965 [Chryseobacterium viscerum]|uniref:Uncharacterized protein n=1 Tax=Chryseobacterium viscerum TaxID=1037377 RepID=A0A316WQD4_9FLAO|nr:hypothetical protein C1634_007965 [Chryseobacterium viscerum]